MKFTDNIPEVACVYYIFNLKTLKFYVGCTINLKNRIKAHYLEMRGNYHINRHLNGLIDEYGEDAFNIMIIDQNKPIEELKELENLLIEKYQDFIYNISLEERIRERNNNYPNWSEYIKNAKMKSNINRLNWYSYTKQVQKQFVESFNRV